MLTYDINIYPHDPVSVTVTVPSFIYAYSIYVY